MRAKLAAVHRRHLLALLDTYEQEHPGESAVVERMRSFVRARADCFERSCLEGHVTGSAWILSADRGSALLTHHAKLGRWLQLGGHSDGEPDPLAVALREAREESGLHALHPVAGPNGASPLDLDIHEIPARPGEPAHFHYDVRYLFVAEPGQSLVRSSESHDLRWVERGRLRELSSEESLLRLEAKALRRLG